MSSLFNSLTTVSESMRTMQEALQVASNNVTNAKTPGYVKQTLGLQAKRLELEKGFAGGVDSTGLISSRKSYLDQAVRAHAHDQGLHSQKRASLERLEPVFDISQSSGVARALDQLFQGFSQWSINPNDSPGREAVLERAREVAQAFQFTAASLDREKQQVTVDLRNNVAAINRLGALIQSYNTELRQDARNLQDAGLDAQLHSALEELSGLVDFQALRAEDGSYSVLLGGQVPLNIGDHLFEISLDQSGSTAVIRDSGGADVTGKIRSGTIKASLDFATSLVPRLEGDLDRLAEGVADRVNTILGAGLDRNGNPGAPLFTYNSTVGSASSLSLAAITPDQLAAAVATAPGGNGNALNLADLANSREIDDSTFSQFYGQIAARVGRELSHASEDERTQDLLLAQARNLRAEETEVSLDEEAIRVIEFQRAYQASGELIRVLNSLTETTINLIR